MTAPGIVPVIVIDARMVEEIPHGISRYVTYLAKALREIDEKKKLPYQPVFLVDPNRFFTKDSEHPLNHFKTVAVESPFLSPKEIFEIPKILKNLGARAYHSPSFSSLYHCPCPWILTLHDLNHLTYGSFSKKIYYWTLLRAFAKKARALVTISKFSQNEIASWLNIPVSQIKIVFNVIEKNSEQPKKKDEALNPNEILARYGLDSGRYFFCTSNSKPHKNLPLLTQAYEKYAAQQKGAWPLAVTVRGYESIPGVVSLGGIPELETQIILNHAGGVVFPSLYEGFGLPPVEGAVAGKALAVSRIPPHEEGLVDLSPSEVHWVTPNDLHGWVSAFHRLWKGEIAAPSQAHRQKILERFNIQRMGESMDQIYRDVLGSTPE